MSKHERNIRKDINAGKELIQTGSETQIELFIETIEGKYSIYIPGLRGIHTSESYQVHLTDRKWKDVLEKVISILETGIDFIRVDGYGRPIPYESESASAITISNENRNQNTNENSTHIQVNITVNQMIEIAMDKIRNELDGVISESEMAVAIEKLEELKKISETNEPANKKWSKLKGIFGWLTTQGVSIFSTVTPIILEMLKANQGK